MVEDLSVDTVVIGAGVVGASCAYHLARAGLRVHVVEAFGGPAEGSTGRSFASIRAQWADPLNIEMSWRSIRAYRSFPADHGIDVGYRPTGYLLLVPDSAWEAQLAAVELQREHEVPVDVLDLAAAEADHPVHAGRHRGRDLGPGRRRGRPAPRDRRLPDPGPGRGRAGAVPAPGRASLPETAAEAGR